MATVLPKESHSALEIDDIIAMPDGLNYSTKTTRDLKSRQWVPVLPDRPFWVTRLNTHTQGSPSLDGRFFQITAFHHHHSSAYPNSYQVAEAQEVMRIGNRWHRIPQPVKILAIEELIRDAKVVHHVTTAAPAPTPPERPAFFTNPVAADHTP